MSWLCHHLNSLHLFCRLRSIGVNKERALRIACIWEMVAHPGLYSGQRKKASCKARKATGYSS